MSKNGRAKAEDCLLYTSDAADERSSVDLGGRRIIKKKKKKEKEERSMSRMSNHRNKQYKLNVADMTYKIITSRAIAVEEIDD